jgi:two-component system chemotaxis response regulator CheB
MAGDDFPIVALVSSTGGLDAVTRVVSPLPAGLPAAILVLQHLDPERTSELPGILDRRSALPVSAAADGDALTPGRILVAPAGRHTLITPGPALALIASGPVPPYRPSADLLLTTLAIAAGTRAVAVVLSGKGSDAATGATAVQHFGGTVLVSSPGSSTEPAMPQATINRHRGVHRVVDLDELGQVLIGLATIGPAGRSG